MTNFLKQSTAVTIKMGPFLDLSDGVTAKTDLIISQADIRLSKNGGDFAQTNNAAGATHDENGYYDVPLDTTDTDTLGRLRVAISEAGALPVWADFMVLPANVYDSLVGGSDRLQVHADEITADLITAAAIATGAFDADALAADAVAEIQSGLALAADLATVGGNVEAILADTNELQVDWANGGRLDNILDARASQASVDVIDGIVDSILDDTGTSGVKVAAGQLSVKKNTALNNFEFLMVDANGDPLTGLTVTAQRSIDGAAFAPCANAATEVGLGIYKIDLANTDLNGNVITFRFSAPGAKVTTITVITQA